MSIRWITPLLGTAPALAVDTSAGYAIVDVRDLVDKDGNRSEAIREKIAQGSAALAAGKQTIICCDYGISRSNAIAVGVLATHESISFEAAARRVMEATGEKEIKAGPLQAVRNALFPSTSKSGDGSARILITGSTGSLGKPISQALAKQVHIVTPTRQQMDLQLGSTQLDLLVAEEGITHILHLANPRVFTSNVALGETLTMLRNVIDVCVPHNIRLVYLSGWEVYSGYRSTHLVADETLPLLPKGPYGETKYLCELMIEHAKRHQALRCMMLRPGPVYGIGMEKPKFIYNFIDKILKKSPITTHCYNNGFPSLDLMHIDDMVSAVEKAVKSDFCGTLNIGTRHLTTTRTIADMLVAFSGSEVAINSAEIDSDTASIALDASRAQEILDWQPCIKLEDGLKTLFMNYVANQAI